MSDRSTPESITYPQTRSTPRSTLLASCVCAVLAGGPAAALELGEPVVRSGLGQPLEVVVPYATWGNERLTAECVSLVRGDAGGLPAVTAGRVSSTAGNRLVIRSDRGIREPLLGLNLKVDCPATPFIVRSYTLIIDPPGLAPATQAPAPMPAPRREPAEPAAVLPSASSAPRASRAPAPSQPLGQGSEYRVRVGDTLSTIAQRVSDRPSSIWVTAERIFAANPGAFIDGDMDRLRAGSVLVIPVLDGAPATAATGPDATAPDAKTPAAAPTGAAATNAPAGDRQATAADSGRSAASSPAGAAVAPATAPAVTAGESTAAGASAERIRPAVRQAMDEMAAAGTDAGGAAETPSPFKAADGGETAPEAVLTPAGPAPDVAAPEPAPRSSVSPLFAALFGAGIGLLMGLVIFRSSVREFFRRAPTPAAARGQRSGAGTSATAAAGTATADAPAYESTDVMATPDFESEEADVIVSEEEWDDATRSRLKSLDLDFGDEDDTLGEEVITEQQLAVARMEFPADDDGETVPETEGPAVLPPEERIDESMIMEVDTGAELAAGKTAQDDAGQEEEPTEDTGALATVADLEMLEEDYEQEFTATQRLAKQLADAAIALDREITAHGDELDDSITAGGEGDTEETVAATAQSGAVDGAEQTGATAVMPRESERDGNIIDEADQTAVLSGDEATAVTPAGGQDEGDTVEHTGVYATATTRLPSADEPYADEFRADETDEDADEAVGETAAMPLSEKRRA